MEDRVKILETRTIYSGSVLTFVEEKVEISPEITTNHLTVRHNGAVVILPQLPDKRLILIKQYRHSVGKEILEFPAGTIDKGEEPLPCATREISEETGYGANTIEFLGTLFPAPGFCNEIQHLYFATDLFSHSLPGDDDEIIEVVFMTPSEVETAIEDGILMDAKSIAIYFKAKLKGLI